MGQKYLLDNMALDPAVSWPIPQLDRGMPSAGALVVIDATHDTVPAIAADLTGTRGIPSAGTPLQNIAAAQATAMGVSGDTRPIFNYTAQFNGSAPTKAKLERSLKGGIHGICSQTLLGSNQYAALNFSPGALAYIVANASHEWFISVWSNVTRSVPQATVANTAFAALATGGNSTTDPGLFAFSQPWATNGDYPPNGAARRGLRRVDPDSSTSFCGPRYANVGAIGWYKTPAAAPTGTALNGGSSAFVWGAAAPFASARPNDCQSAIWYRTVVYDVTVAAATGVSYADLDAADWAYYQAEVLTPTGRFYNDTVPTAPSSIP